METEAGRVGLFPRAFSDGRCSKILLSFLPTAPIQISLGVVSKIMLSGLCSHFPGTHIYFSNEPFHFQIHKAGGGGGVAASVTSSEAPSWEKSYGQNLRSTRSAPGSILGPRLHSLNTHFILTITHEFGASHVPVL